MPSLLFILFSFFIFSLNLLGNNPDSSIYPIQGIDLSHHQGTVDWKAIKKDSRVQFVFMKATEGGDFKDSKFQQNWQHCQDLGIRCGAYHFYSFCRTGKEQADNFIASVPLNKNALPPVIDLEFLGSCKKRPSKEVALSEIQTCLNHLEQHYNKKPILYTSYDFYEAYLQSDLQDYDLWIRDTQKEPQIKDRPWTFWQFSNTGARNGIKGPVDLNTFYGSRSQFDNY